MKLLITIALAATTTAFAQPRPATVQTRTVPCKPDGASLMQHAGEPVICSSDGCMSVFEPVPKAHSRPRPTSAWSSPVARISGHQACLGKTCKPLGTRLRAAIAHAAANPRGSSGEPLRVSATTDLAAVVVDQTAWSLANDQPLQLGGARSDDAEPMLYEIHVAGSLLVANWTTCAGPCSTAIVYGSDGRKLSPEVVGGGEVLQLGPTCFALVGEYATVQIFDLVNGRLLAKRALDGDATEHATVRLGKHQLAVMYTPADGSSTTTIVKLGVVREGKRVRLKTLAQRGLPSCEP